MNKSDSAGKLHQFYTCKALHILFPKADIHTPLLLEQHTNDFRVQEINSLKKIGRLTAKLISSRTLEEIVSVRDVGTVNDAIENTDDIEITTSSGGVETYSLKCAKKNLSLSLVLSKNPGAKSLITKYYRSPELQQAFNTALDELHLKFLNSIIQTDTTTIKAARTAIRALSSARNLGKPRFANFPTANSSRDVFLASLRDKLKGCLSNMSNTDLANAINLILDTGKNHILACYKSGSENVHFDRIPFKNESDIHGFELRGNDSVCIKTSDYIVGFRFKFESDICSSIKLVGDYKQSD